MTQPRTCDTCDCWNAATGECRCLSPVVGGSIKWPVTGAKDWCSEFKLMTVNGAAGYRLNEAQVSH